MNNTIYIYYGNEYKKITIDLLEKIDLKSKINKNAKIGIKPNLVVAKPYTSGATTNPYIVEGVVEYLKNNGFNNIIILEGSWLGDSTQRAFKVCGYSEIAERYNIELFDTKRDTSKKVKLDHLDINVCSKVDDIDFLINIPVLKGHCQTIITCALKNLKGLIPDSEKRRFHTLGLSKPIAYLNKAIKTHFILVDGTMGDLDFEEGGNPVKRDVIFATFDPVLADSFAAEQLGYNWEEISYIKIAATIGVGNPLNKDTKIIEFGDKTKNIKSVEARKVQMLSKYVQEDSSCSACYANLISALNKLNDEGKLKNLKQKIYIGQGFKSKTFDGIGIGNCTSAFSKCIKGCPPKASEIVKFLDNLD